jgi:hypothetical protein
MTTGYTQAELEELQRILVERAPASLTPEDLKLAPHVLAATWAGSYTGFLLNLQFQAQQSLMFQLNCVVALELMIGISEAAVKFGWWTNEPQHKPDDRLPLLDTEQDATALPMSSLTTGAAPNGILVNFGDGETANFRFLLTRSVARQVFATINFAGETAGWWDKEFVLQPARMPEEIEIRRAENQLLKH